MSTNKVYFEIHGFHIDYYVNKKYIGSVKIENPDREVYGYQGRKEELIENEIVFKNKKKIKKGSVATTELIPICGRMIESVKC